MPKVFSKATFNKFLPIILMIAPIVLFIIFFVLAAILMEGAGTFSVNEKTSGQQVLQTIADLFANGAAVAFTFLIPIGFLSGILLIITRTVQKKKS